MQINNESFKLFFLLVQNGNVDISIDIFDDVYKLSKKIEIPKFIKELDKIGFNNLGYVIPKLRRFNSYENEDECD